MNSSLSGARAQATVLTRAAVRRRLIIEITIRVIIAFLFSAVFARSEVLLALRVL
jgi:hypothetical protein